MQAQLEPNEMGEIIRKVRKQKGYRLEDLADGNVSPATISNIERGVPPINQTEALYLLDKLGIPTEQIPHLLLDEQQQLVKLERTLLVLESKLEVGKAREVLHRLESLKIDDSHRLAPLLYYLRGKSWIGVNRLDQAERCFNMAIRLSAQQGSTSNLESASFGELGLLYYRKNDLEAAIQYTDSGIDAFDSQGKRQHVWYILHMNKGLFLERMNRIGPCIQLVEEVWEFKERIADSYVLSVFYWLRSEMYYRTGMYEEAIDTASEGLDLARRGKLYRLICALSTVIGSSLIRIQQLDSAEEFFQLALTCKGKMEDDRSLTNVYIRLALLYKKQHKPLKATQCLTEAIRIAETCQDVPRLVRSWILMGSLLQQHNREAAIGYFEKAADIAQEYGLAKQAHEATVKLAQCWYKQNEQQFQKYIKRMYEIQAAEIDREEKDWVEEMGRKE